MGFEKCDGQSAATVKMSNDQSYLIPITIKSVWLTGQDFESACHAMRFSRKPDVSGGALPFRGAQSLALSEVEWAASL
jgi:hypothetical protein